MSHSIVSAALTVAAIRTNGYKDTAHAVAELMDNAIQAGATRVDLIGVDRTELARERRMTRLKEIAVLDNGAGMDAATLRIALQIGNGTRLKADAHNGIGRFGMGLPASSLSQCRRVDVWSWQNGEEPLHTFLDFLEITAGNMETVPQPEPRELPERYRNALGADAFGPSGTLVVWSDLDRCLWRTTNPLFRNSENLIGRIYRRQIARKNVVIRFLRVDGDINKIESSKPIKPNDPLYLMPGTSCLAPWSETPMFEPWGEHTKTITVRHTGGRHDVRLRFSIAKPDARKEGNAGGTTEHGRHAKQNVGVSLMRADRELDLDQSFVNTYDPRERWWGVEVDFPPALDDVFGVTNNKQNAHNFSELASSDMLDDEGVISDEDDPRVALRQVGSEIKKALIAMRAEIRLQTEGTRTAAATEKRAREEQEAAENGAEAALAAPSPERIASDQTERRRREGHTGASDQGAHEPAPVRVQALTEQLLRYGMSKEDAERIGATVVGIGYTYVFVPARLPSSAFFEVKGAGGTLTIALNTRHPAYHKLLHVFDDDTSDSADDLRERLAQATDGIKLLLEAWARYEDEQPDGSPRQQAVYQARERWGEMAWEFLKGEDNAPP